MRLLSVALLSAAALLTACADEPAASPEAETYKGSLGKADASAQAVFLRLEFDAELLTTGCWSTRNAVQDQLLYTIGQLNGDKSLGRLDHLELTNVKTEQVEGLCKVSYHAVMPVAWNKTKAVPKTYELLLPKDVTYGGQERFTASYKDSCVDWGAHDVDAGSMWYYYRPAKSGCKLADADLVRAKAAVSPSPSQTTGKYPEYHKVWEDDALEVVAVFGKYEDGATTAGDAGIAGYNRFVTLMRDELKPYAVTTVPATLPASPGVSTPDIEISGTLPGGRRVRVVALLVDNVRAGGPVFDARYEALSTKADLIFYNGHAGLGANIRALAQKGEWAQGQYVVVFMNGCDTYAYIDAALAEAHARVNPDDPTGTRYVDVVANAMPSFFHSMPQATMALVRGLMAFDEPKTYEQIFGGVDSAEVVMVTGEHDNVYVPGYGEHEEPASGAWAGLEEKGTVKRDEELRFATPTLPAGRYVFAMTGSGDADLYVRAGDAPGLELYDCRPYLSGTKESCEVALNAPAPIHVLVAGYAATSSFTLVGAPATK